MAERALTDVELERWLAGELPAARVGLATPADRIRLDDLRAEHAAILASLDVAAEVRAIDRRAQAAAPGPRRAQAPWRWLVSGGALAAAVAAVLVVTRRTEPLAPPRDRDDDLTAKGAAVALVIHVARPPDSRRLATGDTVRPGDRLRFEVSVPRRGYVAVVGIDGAGTASSYVPSDGHEPLAIDPAGSGVLPGAIELDATPGDERFYAVYSERTFAVGEPLFAQLRRGGGPPGLTWAEVVLHKN